MQTGSAINRAGRQARDHVAFECMVGGRRGRRLPGKAATASAMARGLLLKGGSAVWRAGRAAYRAATILMRAIISSVALSTGIFSMMMRWMALAQTFSLLSTVNLWFLVNSNGVVPSMNWL